MRAIKALICEMFVTHLWNYLPDRQILDKASKETSEMNDQLLYD